MHTSRGWTLNLNWSDKKSEDKELTPLFWNKFSASDFSRVVHCLFPTYLAHFLPLAITITTTSWCSLLRRVLLFLWGGWGERKRARGARYEGWKLPRALSIFSIIAIFSGIPSGKLCGGESSWWKKVFLFTIQQSTGVCSSNSLATRWGTFTVDSRLLEPSLTRTSRLLISPGFPL